MSCAAITALLDIPVQLGECPIWHAGEQALYWVDIPGQAVHRCNPSSRAHRTWPLPSEPGCIAFTEAGSLLVAMRHGIAILDLDSGTLAPYLNAPYDPSAARFNDGRCDAHGRLWVGSLYDPRDRPAATLYCLEQGRLTDHAMPATVSNGIAFSPDGQVLYRTDTTAHRIDAYDFDVEKGTLSGKRLFHQFDRNRGPGYGGRPDGAAVDTEGAYWVAMYEGGRVVRLSPAGEIMQEIAVPARCPTMVAFGGADLRTLFITTARFKRPQEELDAFPLSGHVLSMPVEVAGLPENTYRI